MFDSVKPWINVTVQILRFISRDGAGDVSYMPKQDIQVYPVSEITVVRNSRGIEVTSSSQLYLDGTSLVSEDDCFIFDGTERPVQAIRTFYRNGVPDIKVVYL